MQASLHSPHERVTWDSSRQGLRVEVYGAGGACGREIAAALLAAGHSPARLSLYARSARKLSWRGQEIQIAPIPSVMQQADVAFLCTPPRVTRVLAPHLALCGTRSLDLSGAFRGEAEVPLVLDGVNAQELGAFTELVAMPLRSSALLARALSVLEREVGLGDVDVFAVLSAANRGARGILELRAELQELGGAGPIENGRVGDLCPVNEAGAEIVHDVRRLLGRPDLMFDASAVVGDLERCDFFAVKTLLYSSLEPADAAELFAADLGLEVVGEESAAAATTATGSPRVHVARIRAGSRGPRSLCFFVLGDQLRAGAAAALRVAARLPAPV